MAEKGLRKPEFARADVHIHLFEHGFQGSFSGRSGVKIDEVGCYTSLAEEHGVVAALVVGYQGGDWCTDNNEFLARTRPDHAWVRPVAYMDPGKPFDPDSLNRLKKLGFIGLSCYIFGQERYDALSQISDEVWSWLVEQRWLVSVNSSGDDWSAWLPVLGRHRDLRVIISHLGLPPQVGLPPSETEARKLIDAVLTLAQFPASFVKLSGFYAISQPSYDYPHETAWPYVEVLLAEFGVHRLLWGSDFSPCLDYLTFPQTFGLFAKIPFLSDTDREKIEGGNLLRLLGQVVKKTSLGKNRET